MSIERATDWQPGDPIHPRAPYRDYLYNFRDDNEGPEPGPDRARWPNPEGHRDLGPGDELADLIAWHTAQRTTDERESA